MAGVTTDFGTCLFANGQIAAGTGNPDVAVDSTPGFNDGQPHVLSFKRIESIGEVDLYVDGVFMGTTTGTTSPLQAPQRLVLGAQQTLTYFLTGDIAEIKIYDSALGDTDRASEENTLINRWTPKPALSFGPLQGSTFSISWPAWASGWQLFNTSNLTPPSVWSLVTNNAISNSGYFTVSVPIGPGSRFFRLSAP